MAEDDLGWHGNVHDGMATLFWGIPQSGYAEIAFSCHSGSQGAGFVFAFAPIHAVDGVEVTVTLEAGDIAIPIRTTGALMQMDDQFLLEGQVAVDAQLVALLDAPGLLSVFVEDGSVEYPLDGAREAWMESPKLSRMVRWAVESGDPVFARAGVNLLSAVETPEAERLLREAAQWAE